jgi:peptidyl-prolyl cis-trans isomerase B (cyclophilin B)
LLNVMMKSLQTSPLRRWSAVALVAIALFLGSCTQDSAEAPAPEAPETTEEVAPEPAADPTADLPQLNGSATVALTVNGGRIVIEVDGENAPVTAGNFVDLVERGIYNGVLFHRVVREPQPFVVQGGDPQTTDPNVSPQMYGTGGFTDPATGQSRMIPLEIKPAGAEEPVYGQTFDQAQIGENPVLRHERGAVAMARSQMPNSASSQFYITLADIPFLDGDYAVFGYVTEGLDVVDGIEQGDQIESAEVISGLENLVTSADGADE